MDINALLTFLSFAIPLYCVYQLGSLAGIFSERSGVANVAIEGNMIIGAIIYAIFYENMHMAWGIGEMTSIFLAMGVAVLLSSTYMMLLSHVTNRYMGDHIIVGTGMNLLAPAIGFLLYVLFSAKTLNLDPSAISFVYDANIIRLTTSTGQFNGLLYSHLVMIAITITLVFVSAHFLNHTRFGLRLKSSGENPYSLETAGVSVAKTRRHALWLAGLLSSLAGVAFTMVNPVGSQFFFTVNGSGFIAIGIIILGQYKVSGSTIGSIVFAILIGFFNSIPFVSGNDLLVSHQNLMKAIPFIIPLIGLMVFRKSFVPAAVGQNFKKDQR